MIATSSSIVITDEETYSAWPWTDTKGAKLRRFRFTSKSLNFYSGKKTLLQFPLLFASFLRYYFFLLWYRPQIVHLIYINIDSWFALYAKKLLHFKLVTSCRGSDILRMDEQSPYKQMLIRDTLRATDAVTAVSQEIAEKIREIAGSDIAVHVIPNGITLSEISFSETNPDTFVFVGHLNNNKNPEFLLNTFVEFYKHHPKYKLTMIGTGPLLNELKRIRQDQGMESVVEITGKMSAETTMERIRHAIALVVPSQSEGCPNVILEAMSVGAPVIGTDRSGIKEIISDGENGLLFQFNDSMSLIACMEKIIESSDFRKRLARNAFLRLRETYDQNKLLDRYLALYADLLRH